jgi:hypothetical protein
VDDDFSGLLLSGASPAIYRGVAQYLAVSGEPIPPAPITGFLGAAPDLGWREFGSPIVITPTASPIPSVTLVASLTPIATLTFTITPIPATPTVATLTPVPSFTAVLPSPTIPAATATLTPLPSITSTPSPAILTVTPNTAGPNATVNVTITGSGFANGAVVLFEGGQGTPPQVTSTQVVNPTTIVITVTTPADTTLGTQQWDLRITNPNTSFAFLDNAFTVAVGP